MTTIAQLAYCDSVQLCTRTGLSFQFILDVVAQALAWIYLADKMDKLRPGGLRGALEIKDLVDDFQNEDSDIAAAAKKLLESMATATQLDVAQLQNACEQIAGDPYTEFLSEVWACQGR